MSEAAVSSAFSRDATQSVLSPATFTPLTRPLCGRIQIPGDKSVAHRALLLAAAARGTSTLDNLPLAGDVATTRAAIESLGACVTVSCAKEHDRAKVSVAGWGDTGPRLPAPSLDCGGSGTTARLLMGLLAGHEGEFSFLGDASLCARPMARVVEPLTQMGASFTHATNMRLPLTMHGSRNLQAIDIQPAVASAQVKTALLFAGLRAQGTTTIRESLRTRDHTEHILPCFDVPVSAGDEHGIYTVHLDGPVVPRACDIVLPGDPSSAAFLIAAAVLKAGSEITIENLLINETRLGFVRVLQRMGADIRVEQTGESAAEPVGIIQVAYSPKLKGTTLCAAEVPQLIDEMPLLALVATTAHGDTRLTHVDELRVKETDRLASVLEGLAALGCVAHCESWTQGGLSAGDTTLVVSYGPPQRSAQLASAGDHRMAMWAAVAGLCFDVSVTLDDFACVAVSYPGFLDAILQLTDNRKNLKMSF